MKKNLVNACFVLLFFLSFACKFRAIVLLNNPKNPFYMKEIQPFIKIIDGVPHKFNTKEEMDIVIDRTKAAVTRFRKLGSFR